MGQSTNSAPLLFGSQAHQNHEIGKAASEVRTLHQTTDISTNYLRSHSTRCEEFVKKWLSHSSILMFSSFVMWLSPPSCVVYGGNLRSYAQKTLIEAAIDPFNKARK